MSEKSVHAPEKSVHAPKIVCTWCACTSSQSFLSRNFINETSLDWCAWRSIAPNTVCLKSFWKGMQTVCTLHAKCIHKVCICRLGAQCTLLQLTFLGVQKVITNCMHKECTCSLAADIMQEKLAFTPGCAKSLLKVLSVEPATERTRPSQVLPGVAHLINKPNRLFRTEVHCHTSRALPAGIKPTTQRVASCCSTNSTNDP